MKHFLAQNHFLLFILGAAFFYVSLLEPATQFDLMTAIVAAVFSIGALAGLVLDLRGSGADDTSLLAEGPVTKGGHNPPNTSSARPPAPGGSGP